MNGLARRSLLGWAAALAAGCGNLPDKPVRATQYDFGPAVAPAAAPAASTLPPLVLPEIEASRSFDGAAIHYRLGYADAHQLRAYAQARWSAPAVQLVRQRLREHLGRERVVLDSEEAAGLRAGVDARPRVLRLHLEEFTHFFETSALSHGALRLRCTLLEQGPAGERPVGQRVISTRAAAPSPDAPGGVRALAAATDAAAQELARWLQQAP